MKKTTHYQLVLSDIDGTLLTDENKMLPSTEITIRDLVKSGILFATASARTKPFTKNAVSAIVPVCCANAYLNGAFVETSSGEVLMDSPLEDEEVSHVVEQCNAVRASCVCFSTDEVIAKLYHQDLVELFRQYYGEYSEKSIIDSSELETYLIAVYAEHLYPVVEGANRLPNTEVSPIASFDTPKRKMEVSFIQRTGVNKGAALRTIATYYRIALSQTVAIGDGLWNDGPMISTAGCGVAMKNAHKEIQSKAHYVTEKDNNEDGVGIYLRDFFKL